MSKVNLVERGRAVTAFDVRAESKVRTETSGKLLILLDTLKT